MQAIARQQTFERVVYSSSKKTKKVQKNPALSYLVGLTITGIILAFMYIVQYATIVQANSSIQEITKQISILEKENDILKKEIGNFKSPNNIKKIAALELGMVLSQEKDIIILNE